MPEDPFQKFKRDKFISTKPKVPPQTLKAQYAKTSLQGNKSPIQMSFGTYAQLGTSKNSFNSIFNCRFNLTDNFYFKFLTEDFNRFILDFKYRQVDFLYFLIRFYYEINLEFKKIRHKKKIIF